MKNISLFLFIVLIGFVQSCREEYLNEPAPTDAVAPDVAYGSYQGAKAHIAGILRRTRGQFTATDAGNLGSLYFARENKGNISINNGSWFSFDYENDNREPNYRRTVFTWNFPYYLIGQVNAFIDGVEKSTAISQVEKDELLGQAYTMRAFFYFELSLEFQHTYSYDPSLPAPPLYTEAGALEGKPMSTMQEMYAQITQDLEYALSIGTMSRENKSYFNKAVTHAVAARVYQVMEDWPKAASNARAAYGGNVASALSPSVYKLGFDDMDEGVEWLLADPQTADQSNYYYLAPHGFYTRTESAYNNTFINRNFVALFSPTDVRNTFKQTGVTDYRQWYTTKFKFAFDADLALIRTAEMILIEAEALYHSNPAAAHALLYSLQVNRDPSKVKSANTGSALLEEILTERKKELYGEIGVEWYDAKRLQRGLPRDAFHRVNLASKPMLPNDKRFFLKIPQAEIDANPNIDASINADR
ncbi:RagB/SusD family nutrient uptake outer membrane protein [Planobacterium oryzisoli]|uniref:RagB/SusD family nutrient uptake outer membrane protein n=1 Tax=Planobacterium oryzisoli TaxID=2771435 RepID=A0A930YV42_9FLAO|nr:RagB/SusD family nutrient uptake outer membrane protein [Planobacterium oryzisoli]MBF5026836.1 RagB/SusD family nutrient uptake outer membrane protein [Planobacterium oryzisoli]